MEFLPAMSLKKLSSCIFIAVFLCTKHICVYFQNLKFINVLGSKFRLERSSNIRRFTYNNDDFFLVYQIYSVRTLVQKLLQNIRSGHLSP